MAFLSKRHTNARTLWGVVIALGLVATGFFFVRMNTPYVPEEFTKGRESGTEAAQTLSAAIDASLKNLSQIAAYDKQGNFNTALTLVRTEITQMQEKKDLATKLADALSKMAEAIPEIRPRQARDVAVQAVSVQLSAVSHLISYNDYLVELFTLLQTKLQQHLNTDGRVNTLIGELNAESQSINDLSIQFVRFLTKFDTLVKAQ